MDDKVTITVRMPPEMIGWLDEQTAKRSMVHRMSRGSVVRWCVAQAMVRHERGLDEDAGKTEGEQAVDFFKVLALTDARTDQ